MEVRVRSVRSLARSSIKVLQVGIAAGLVMVAFTAVQPAGAATPSIVVTPNSAVIGATVSTSVSGFLPGEVVDISFNNVFVGQCVADPTGACNALPATPAAI